MATYYLLWYKITLLCHEGQTIESNNTLIVQMNLPPLIRPFVDRLLRLDGPLVLLAIFILRHLGYRAYRLFIYPYFVSPLRNLPGPKARAHTHDICPGKTANSHSGPPFPYRPDAQPVSERPSQRAVCLVDAKMAEGASDPVF